VHSGQAPVNYRLQDGDQAAAQFGQAVFDLWRDYIVLPAMYQPTKLQFLQFTTQNPRGHGLAERAFEERLAYLSITIGPPTSPPTSTTATRRARTGVSERTNSFNWFFEMRINDSFVRDHSMIRGRPEIPRIDWGRLKLSDIRYQPQEASPSRPSNNPVLYNSDTALI
jgi:hypothetical protein